MKGFSVRNLKYMRQWFQFWSVAPAIGQQLIAQISWGHNSTIGILICKEKNNTVVEYALKDIHKPMGMGQTDIIRRLYGQL